jgi:hypothetical protein
MSTEGAPLTRPHAFGLVCWAIATGYGLFLVPPTSLPLLALVAGPLIAAATWLAADAKHTRVANVVDSGWLFYLFLPFAIPWYAMKTRGRRGWRLALRLYVLSVAGLLGFPCGALLHVLASTIIALAG